MKAKTLLKRIEACDDAIEWVGERDIPTAWRECERGDWMLWIDAKMSGKRGWPTRQEVVLAACACAATALRFVPPGERRPHKAIATARKWARGKATIEEALDAAAYAYAAYAYASADATTYAAYAAYSAAFAANEANAASSAAAYAAAAYAHSDNAAADARQRSLKRSAGIVRRMLVFDAVKDVDNA